MRRSLSLAITVAVVAGCGTPQRTTTNNPPPSTDASDSNAFMGARGPDGPTGETGPRGAAGPTGVDGYAAVGPRGPAGPAGPMGEQGRTGAQGASGDVVMGPTGSAGSAGRMGAQGDVGQAGSQGASGSTNSALSGPAGPVGSMGPSGPRGATGDTGAKGVTLVGPAGPAGRAGPAGARGADGTTGAQGRTLAGLPGPAGAAGPAGEAGAAGSRGADGQVGALQGWASYREFWFETDQVQLHNGDAEKVSAMARYLRANPSLQVGLDRPTTSGSKDQPMQDLTTQRIESVRSALLAEGIAPSRISSGAFANARQARDGRVAVLLRTDASATPPIVPSNGTAVAERWTTSQEFWFEKNGSDLHASDQAKINDLAALVRQDPTIRLGVDGGTNHIVGNSSDGDIARRRCETVHDALIAAGVPSASIVQGDLIEAGRQRERCVMVLIRSTQVAQAPAVR